MATDARAGCHAELQGLPFGSAGHAMGRFADSVISRRQRANSGALVGVSSSDLIAGEVA